MATPDREVRRLRLAAADAGAARALLPRLEDALRCASLPDTGAQWLLVRRLALGPVAATASTQAIARLVERHLCDAAPAWRDGAAADAVDADHVRFASPLQAQEALALRVLREQPCRAWYWARVAPGFAADAAPARNLSAIERAVAAAPQGVAALAAWRHAVAAFVAGPATASARDDAAPVCNATGPQAAAPGVAAGTPDRRPAIGAAVAASAARAPSQPQQPHGGTAAAPTPSAIAMPAETSAAGTAARPLDLPSMRAADLTRTPAVAAGKCEAALPTPAGPPRSGAPRLPHASVPRTAAAPGGATPHVPDTPLAADTPATHADASGAPLHPAVAPAAARPAAVSRARASGPPRAEPAASRVVGARPGPSSADRTQPRAPAEPAAPSSALARPAALPASPDPPGLRHAQPARHAGAPRACAAGEPSSYAGLLFMLPVLLRLGLPPWALRHDADATAWTRMVLLAALQRLRASPQEPLFALLAGAPPDAAGTGAMPAFCNAAALSPPRGRPAPTLGEAWTDAATVPAQAEVWLHGCRRWLRRGPGVGLASLVRRPGRVAWSPTHVDVVFDLAGADLRVRRHGLDIDPGWLPWFGRVVAFHYIDRP